MKRVISVALVLLLLICFTSAFASAPGSSGDPLVSLGYTTNTFATTVLNECDTLVRTAMNTLFDNASNNISEVYNNTLLRLGSYEDFSFASSFTPVSLPAGTSAKLVTGSTFILTAGSALLQIEKGTVINISTGKEVASASTLTLNQRYFCAEDTLVSFIASTDTICQIDGLYKSNGTIVVLPHNFVDVKSTDWYYTAVNFARDNALFTGTTDITFSPQTSMTRGMFVTVLYRLAGKPALTASSVFPDVSSSAAYYYAPVIWASTNAIVAGYDTGNFGPEDQITREQMAVIMYRYARYAGYSTTPASTSAFEAYPDKGNVSTFAVDAIKWATSSGLINGLDGKLMPKNTASRAEVAQIILSFCQKIVGM